MSAELRELVDSLRQLDEERLRIRDLAVARVKRLQSELVEAERLVAQLSGSVPPRPIRRRNGATTATGKTKRSVTKPVMEALVTQITSDNPDISVEEVWELVSDHLLQDGISRSGAKLLFNRVSSAVAAPSSP